MGRPHTVRIEVSFRSRDRRRCMYRVSAWCVPGPSHVSPKHTRPIHDSCHRQCRVLCHPVQRTRARPDRTAQRDVLRLWLAWNAEVNERCRTLSAGLTPPEPSKSYKTQPADQKQWFRTLHPFWQPLPTWQCPVMCLSIVPWQWGRHTYTYMYTIENGQQGLHGAKRIRSRSDNEVMTKELHYVLHSTNRDSSEKMLAQTNWSPDTKLC